MRMVARWTCVWLWRFRYGVGCGYWPFASVGKQTPLKKSIHIEGLLPDEKKNSKKHQVLYLRTFIFWTHHIRLSAAVPTVDSSAVLHIVDRKLLVL